MLLVNRVRVGGRVLGASNRSILQAVLTADYDGLVKRLTRRFGSSDFASETLHETFARLDGMSNETVLKNPKDYLFRAAINVGKNRLRAERLRASAADIDAVLDVAADNPGPAQIAEARSEMDALLRALEGLPARTRQVFEAALFRDLPYAQIAENLGISIRTVERDVQTALEHCSRVLGYRALRKAEVPPRRS